MLYLFEQSIESSIAPIVVLASNRGMTTIRGTDDDKNRLMGVQQI